MCSGGSGGDAKEAAEQHGEGRAEGMRGSNKKVRRLSQRGSRRFAVACSA